MSSPLIILPEEWLYPLTVVLKFPTNVNGMFFNLFVQLLQKFLPTPSPCCRCHWSASLAVNLQLCNFSTQTYVVNSSRSLEK